MTCDVEDAQQHHDGAAAEFARLYEVDDRWVIKRLFNMQAFVRLWPDGTEDTIFVLRGPHAFAIRHAPDGRPAWSVQGSLRQLVGLVMRLDPPGSPNAETPLDSAPPRVAWHEQ